MRRLNLFVFGVVAYLVIVVALCSLVHMWRTKSLSQREIIWSLQDRLVELGVKSEIDPTALTGVRYAYTNATRQLMKVQFFGSRWNLEQVLQEERLQADLAMMTEQEETDMVGRLEEGVKDLAEMLGVDLEAG